MKKGYSIKRAASWYTIGNFLVKGVSFFVLPIFTKLMTTEEYGVYGVFSSYLSIVEVIILFGLSATVNIAKYSDGVDFEKYVSTIILIPILLFVILGVVVNGAFLLCDELLGMGRTLWNWLLVTTLLAAISGIMCAKLIIEGRYILYMVYSILGTVCGIGISIILCYTFLPAGKMYMAKV